MVGNLGVRGKFANSDHEKIRFSIKWKTIRVVNRICIPNSRTGNYEGLGQHLAGIKWDGLIRRFDPGERNVKEEQEKSGRAADLTEGSKLVVLNSNERKITGISGGNIRNSESGNVSSLQYFHQGALSYT